MNVFNGKVLYGSQGDDAISQFMKVIISGEQKTEITIPAITKYLNSKYIKLLYINTNMLNSLKTIVISDSFETVDITPNNEFLDFRNFAGLKRIVFGKNINLGEIGVKLSPNYSFQEFEVSSENPHIKIVNNKALLSKDGKKLHSFIFSSTQESIDLSDLIECEKILPYVFNLGNFKTISLPPNLKEIAELSFSSNNKLKEITFPQGFKKIGEKVFYGVKLNKVFIPNTVEHIGRNAFEKQIYNSSDNPTFYTNIGNSANLRQLLQASGFTGYNNTINIIEQ